MRHVRSIAIMWVLLIPITAWAQNSLSPQALLQEAEHQQQILGNADAALRNYEKVIDHSEATRDQMAQARLAMTDILVDLGRIDEARIHADWLTANMPDSPQANAALAKLAHLTQRDPAALMPANTLIYMELVQPGRQLEQILEMLQESGLDESLEALMNNMQRTGTRPGGPARPSPLRMILNPSLLSELKKIEGLAFGVTKLNDPATRIDDPEFVGILLPGQSQAVRGMVQMLLTMSSKSVETIGESTLHRLKGNGQHPIFAAITPDAILLGSPRESVTATVDRLNGEDSASSLADQQRFQRQAGARRQDSVILMYADVHKILSNAKDMMETHKAHELALLNELADIEAIDDLSLRSRLMDDGVAFEMAVTFKPDRPNTFYKLIHTPPADRALLNYIPADTLACVLMSLDDGAAKYDALMDFAEKAVEIARRTEPGKDHNDPAEGVTELESALGINLRDDLFANIVSIAAAVTAPGDEVLQLAAAGDDPDSAYALSSLLAIRVKSPDQFQKALTTMASAAARHHLKDPNAEAAITTDKVNDVPVSRYTIPGAEVTPVVARFDDIFVITLHEPFTREIVNNVHGKTQILSSTPRVAETLATLPDQANKLLIIRPEVVLEATQKIERLKTGAASTHTTPLEPDTSYHPMVGYTLENGESLTTRLEIRDAAALLAQLMKLHKANHPQHQTQAEATPTHTP